MDLFKTSKTLKTHNNNVHVSQSLIKDMDSKVMVCLVACFACIVLALVGVFIHNSKNASADVADVTFDDVSLQVSARIFLNGSHSVTAIPGGKVVANETNGKEVLSSETSSELLKFIGDKYGTTDALTATLSTPSLFNASIVDSYRSYLPAVDRSYWLSDVSKVYGVPTQAYRSASNFKETLTKAAQGKAPDGTLFTPAPVWAVNNLILDYWYQGYPKKSLSLNGYDVTTETKFDDCGWPNNTETWSLDSTNVKFCIQHSVTLSRTIYAGKEVYNNPYCIEDHSRGYYKTTATGEYWDNKLIDGRVELFGGSETAEPAAFFHTGLSYMYSPINVGDVLYLAVDSSGYLKDTTGFLISNVARTAGPPVRYYNVYFKAEEAGKVNGLHLYDASTAVGVHAGTQDSGAVKGQTISAGKHAVRPMMNLDASRISFFRASTSTSDLTVSSNFGGAPPSSANYGEQLKSVVKSSDTKISFDVKTDNCSTDRDPDEDRITFVEGATIKVPWNSKTLTLDNVSTQNANYITALVQTSTNKKYSVLAKSEEGKVKINLSTIMSNATEGDKVTVSLYAEQANESGFSDLISEKPVTFQIEISGLVPQKIVYDINGGVGDTPEDTVANAGDQVKVADGSELTSADGNAFSRWELIYTSHGSTEETHTRYRSGDQLIMPDASADATTGIIIAKAIYAGGMTAEKATGWEPGFDVKFVANAPDGTTATVDGTNETSTKTVKNGKALTSDVIPADSGLKCEATDGSVWAFGGWSENKNDTIENSLTNAELTDKAVAITGEKTYYAIWMKTDGFWLGTKGADATYFNEAQFKKKDKNYVNATQILADKVALHSSSSSTAYTNAKSRWDTYYSEGRRLYSTYSGASFGVDQLVEFGIAEVSGSSGHDGDLSAVTFVAVHTVPTGCTYGSTSRYGWATSALRTNLNSGTIYGYFPSKLKDNIVTVSKKYCYADEDDSCVNTYRTCDDKFWAMSYCELTGSSYSGACGMVPIQSPKAEGVQYAAFKDSLIAYNKFDYKRSGGQVASYTGSLTRSPSISHFSGGFLNLWYWDYAIVVGEYLIWGNGTNVTTTCGVSPAFCF